MTRDFGVIYAFKCFFINIVTEKKKEKSLKCVYTICLIFLSNKKKTFFLFVRILNQNLFMLDSLGIPVQ